MARKRPVRPASRSPVRKVFMGRDFSFVPA
jgi:hypothetical protein